MTDPETETRSIALERELPHPPERVWRALTQPELIAEWLMKGDFRPEIGHEFAFNAEWGDVECRVLEIEPQRMLSYAWEGLGLESVVTWTLEPSHGGTLLRMTQTGFKPEQKHAYFGAKAGWPRFLKKLDSVLEGMA